mgnify:FL=1|tara:strand:+ start:97 stop:633 length:537 start_codon:yes stop_codon:yes gene_type:complete
MAKINTVTVDVENNIYPAYGFFFQVNFLDISSSDLNTRFQSVNGISKTSKSKKIANGGYNDYEYKLPINASYKDITLKRGIIKSNSDNSKDIIHWLENLGFSDNGVRKSRIKTIPIEVILLNPDKNSFNDNDPKQIQKWSFYHCYPTSVVISEFNSQKSDIAIETLTLAYSNYIRTVL